MKLPTTPAAMRSHIKKHLASLKSVEERDKATAWYKRALLGAAEAGDVALRRVADDLPQLRRESVPNTRDGWLLGLSEAIALEKE